MTTALRLSGVTLPGSGYPKLVNFLTPQFPVDTDLVGLYVLGGNESQSLVNRADAELPLIKVGSPVINSLGAETNWNNCFDTQLMGGTAVTMIAIARLIKPASNDGRYLMISNYNSSPSDGDSLAFDYNSAPVLTAYAERPDGDIDSVSIGTSSGTAGNWNIFAMRIKSTGEVKPWWSRNGTLSSATELAAETRGTGALPFRIGGHHNIGSFQATGEIQLAAIFDGALSDAEIESNIAYLRTIYGPAVGMTTL